MKNILAIPGSTRMQSSNNHLIKAIAVLYAEDLNITPFHSPELLPHFNPDHASENTPEPVLAFRRQILQADGVIICTPEYAHGVPGTLKNAIDWTVGSGEFSQKPVVLITASTDGKFAHESLLETLRVIEAKDIAEFNLLIQFVQTKVSGESKITDEKTLEELKTLMDRFLKLLN